MRVNLYLSGELALAVENASERSGECPAAWVRGRLRELLLSGGLGDRVLLLEERMKVVESTLEEARLGY